MEILQNKQRPQETLTLFNLCLGRIHLLKPCFIFLGWCLFCIVIWRPQKSFILYRHFFPFWFCVLQCPTKEAIQGAWSCMGSKLSISTKSMASQMFNNISVLLLVRTTAGNSWLMTIYLRIVQIYHNAKESDLPWVLALMTSIHRHMTPVHCNCFKYLPVAKHLILITWLWGCYDSCKCEVWS